MCVCVHIGDSITPFCPIGTKRCNGVSNPPVKYRVLFRLYLRRRVVILLLTVIRYTWVITRKWYYPKPPCLNPLSPWVINFCHYLLYVLGGVYTRCIKKKKPNERDLYKMYQKEKTERAKAKFGSVLSHLTHRLGKTHTISTRSHAVSAK